ncbi:hypothetical protein DPEC_G00338280 [Dallia pectoralis]|uniref:Uncharacterized protein n=1 Tax=Dallia pectoralis TaxID=75939 RepID=A0ACC2F4H8_DALPE|nr:hypothetical protein DPEC_G00338280 [Dallia pectoralis]
MNFKVLPFSRSLSLPDCRVFLTCSSSLSLTRYLGGVIWSRDFLSAVRNSEVVGLRRASQVVLFHKETSLCAGQECDMKDDVVCSAVPSLNGNTIQAWPGTVSCGQRPIVISPSLNPQVRGGTPNANRSMRDTRPGFSQHKLETGLSSSFRLAWISDMNSFGWCYIE